MRRVGVVLILVAATAAFATALAGQTTTTARKTVAATKPPAPSPITASIKSTYEMVKDYVTKSAAQFAEKDYGFKPSGVATEVRTFGQIIGHIANANFTYCGAVSATPAAGTAGSEAGPGGVDYEKTTVKADLQKALAASFAACDKAFAAVNDRNAGVAVTGLVIGPQTRLGTLAFNNAHVDEHYGNLVTYMRAKGMIPPSSQGSGR